MTEPEIVENVEEITDPKAPLFVRGDKCLVNGGVLADILTYDVEADRVVFVTYPSGGGTDTTTAHISNTKLDKVPSPDDVPAEEPAVVAEPEAPVSVVKE